MFSGWMLMMMRTGLAKYVVQVIVVAAAAEEEEANEADDMVPLRFCSVGLVLLYNINLSAVRSAFYILYKLSITTYLNLFKHVLGPTPVSI